MSRSVALARAISRSRNREREPRPRPAEMPMSRREALSERRASLRAIAAWRSLRPRSTISSGTRGLHRLAAALQADFSTAGRVRMRRSQARRTRALACGGRALWAAYEPPERPAGSLCASDEIKDPAERRLLRYDLATVSTAQGRDRLWFTARLRQSARPRLSARGFCVPHQERRQRPCSCW
jgi:hypothetical protein